MIIIVILFVIFNIWVWFYPDGYLDYMKGSKGAKIETLMPSLKDFQKDYDNPKYILIVRIITGVFLAVAIYVWIIELQ